LQRNSRPKPAAGKIQDVVDEGTHAQDTGLKQFEKKLAAIFRLFFAKQPQTARNGCERITQIMTENSYELLAQHRRLSLGLQKASRRLFRFLTCLLTRQQLTLIFSAFSDLEERDAY